MGLTLGDDSRLDPALARDFQATGVDHLLVFPVTPAPNRIAAGIQQPSWEQSPVPDKPNGVRGTPGQGRDPKKFTLQADGAITSPWGTAGKSA
jgi:hypothetical protein